MHEYAKKLNFRILFNFMHKELFHDKHFKFFSVLIFPIITSIQLLNVFNENKNFPINVS